MPGKGRTRCYGCRMNDASAPAAGFPAATHSVVNQPAPLESFNAWDSDAVLRHWIAAFGGARGDARLRAYGARVTPHMFLIAPDGKLVYQGAIDSIKSTRVSDIDNAENYVKAAYEAHTKGKEIENPTTTPYGCGVKY